MAPPKPAAPVVGREPGDETPENAQSPQEGRPAPGPSTQPAASAEAPGAATPATPAPEQARPVAAPAPAPAPAAAPPPAVDPGTGLVAAPARIAAIEVGGRGLELRSLDDYWRFAQIVLRAGMAPKGFEKPEEVLVAVQLGAEVGLSPMASLQNIAVIGGRPTVWGSAVKALVERSGLLEDYEEWIEHQGARVDRWPSNPDPTTTAFVRSKRRGGGELINSFSVSQAQKAALWTKQGPWQQYPHRMLVARARSWNLFDNFGDVLKGLRDREEVMDIVDAEVVDRESPTGPNGEAPIAMPERR